MDCWGGAGLGHPASACSLLEGQVAFVRTSQAVGCWIPSFPSPPAPYHGQTASPSSLHGLVQTAVTLLSQQGSSPRGEGEVKAAQLIALASRILLMNQPPQKAADIWDFVESSRWEDLERSHPFIELNIPECSPRLSRDEATHQPGKRQVQSHAKHTGVHRWVGLGTHSLPAPRGKSHPGAPIPTTGYNVRGRQRNAAGEAGTGRIQSPPVK